MTFLNFFIGDKMNIFKRKTVCKNCGLKIVRVFDYGSLKWFHVKRNKKMNRYCAMMSDKDLPKIPMTDWTIAEPKKKD